LIFPEPPQNSIWLLTGTTPEISLTFRKQLGVAVTKLEKLKALEAHVMDSSTNTFLGEVNVNVLRGDTEEVGIQCFQN
jgi:hypothetical protein